MFITLEGGEGAGKTTQISLLKDFLEKDFGYEVILTREPGGTVGAEELRSIVCTGDINKWNPISETLIYYAARADHLEKKILPALKEGKWVISDRFSDSTLAYQYYGYNKQGISLKNILEIEKIALNGFKPDLTFILDLSPEIGLKRVSEKHRFEEMDLSFHERLRQGYLEIAHNDLKRCRIIDASKSISEVSSLIKAEIKKHLQETKC